MKKFTEYNIEEKVVNNDLKDKIYNTIKSNVIIESNTEEFQDINMIINDELVSTVEEIIKIETLKNKLEILESVRNDLYFKTFSQDKLNEEIDSISEKINGEKIPFSQITKKQYDELEAGETVTISKLSTKFNHKPSPQTYIKYPLDMKIMDIMNPYTKEKETVNVINVEHEDWGIYIKINKINYL